MPVTGAVAHIIEDAAKVLHTKSESSGMITLVATEGLQVAVCTVVETHACNVASVYTELDQFKSPKLLFLYQGSIIVFQF